MAGSHVAPRGPAPAAPKVIRHLLNLGDGPVDALVATFGRRRRSDHEPPIALGVGAWEAFSTEPLLVRVQSSCVYGEVFGSIDCDCRGQLDLAMARIRAEGRGLLVYLSQEGRGAGIVAKARGYRLSQEQNVDSFTAYHRLRLAPDSRNYEEAAVMLTQLGIRAVRLLTNNPAKVVALRSRDIVVAREELWITGTDGDGSLRTYLESKLRRGHFPPGDRQLQDLRLDTPTGGIALLV